MKFDSTVNFALLLTLCSIVLPTITTILNNRHQIKIRKMDFNFDKKFATIEAYIEAVGCCIELNSLANVSRYNKAKGMLYLYVPKKLRKKIGELDACIKSNRIDEAKKLFDDLCISLSDIINQK